tara:strand:- start:1373 stop:2824 length:1452 start_codon:yes stop_codon:yes gene_type:complete
MSYQNPLIIQNNPGGNIGEAANKAATSIQDAILFNMEKQEKKQEEIAKKQAIDDANAIAAAKESSTEEADARKALAANEYSVGGMDAFNLSSGEKFKYNQIVANVNATREDRLAAQEKINAENTFQQNQIGALAYFSEDKTELATLRAEGNVYFDDKGLQGAYVRFLDGNPNVKLSGKRVGNNWVNTLIEDGATYELPTDKIKDGSFKAFALTPDLYKGIDDQAKEINAARNKREKGMQEFTPNDLAGITEAVNVNIDKAKANFTSYLEADPIKARAVLSNSIFPGDTKKINDLMNDLQSGDASGDPDNPGRYDEALAEVNAEMTKDIEYKWGMNTGVFRNDKNEFEVIKPKEESDLSSNPASGGTAEWTLNQEIADLNYKTKNVDKTNYFEVLDLKIGERDIEGSKYNKVTEIKNNIVKIYLVDPSNTSENFPNGKPQPGEEFNLTNKSHVMSYLKNKLKYSTGTYKDMSELAQAIIDVNTK